MVIEIDGLEQVLANLENLGDGIQNPSDGLLESIETNFMPALIDAASSVWTPRTGNYAGGWNAESTDPQSVTVSNPVEYAWPLETGWTTRNGGFVESPGVLFPTAEATANDVAQGLVNWLMSRVGP